MTERLPTWPQLGEAEINAVTAVLGSNELSQLSGSHVAEFERAFADYHSTSYCVATSSGTAAIHLVLAALAIGPGDEVIVPTHTFVASAAPVLYQGATPIFADIDQETFCIDVGDVARRVTRKTRAIVAVHLNGHPAAMRELRALRERFGFALIEDAAQAHGARYGGTLVGNFGNAACFSFWQDKIMTTGGEGGAVLTDDAELATRLRRLRHHGERPAPGNRKYHHVELGYNYRMTAMQAAIGSAQLTRLGGFVAARRRNAALLSDQLAGIPSIVPPRVASGADPSWWKYVCRIDPAALRVKPSEFLAALNIEGVPALPRYPIPLHRQPVFEAVAPSPAEYPVAESLKCTLFSLPVHPALDAQHIEWMTSTVADVAASLSA